MHNKQPILNGLERIVHPQEQWEWPIAVYLYLAGLGAGAYAVGLLTDYILHPDLPTRAILLWGPILVTIGAPFLILDLGKKLRFINASLNPWTSWAGRGFLILSTLMITGLIVFGVNLLPEILPLLKIETPNWIDPQLTIYKVLEIIALVFSFFTAAYTGIFLKSTRYVGLWNTWFLPTLFLISALSTGSMGIIVSLMGYGLITDNNILQELSHQLTPVEQILVLIEAVVLALYIIMRYRAQGSALKSVQLLLNGKYKLVFWVGIIGLGLLLPTILELVQRILPEYPYILFVTGASALTGGFFLRYGVVKSGLKELHPLHKMLVLQYDWKNLDKPAYGQGKEVSHG
jgi:polysulfide reductase chain C